MTDPLSRLRRFLRELKRRNVYRVAATYLVAAFVVWQVADFLFPALQFPAWTVDFIVIVSLLGFPLALIVAWAFEMTSEGVRRTPKAEEPEAAVKETSTGTRRATQILAALGVVAVAGAGVWQFTPIGGEDEPEKTSTPRIAVLPFENIAPDSTEDYFAQGMHEEVLNQLSKVSGLEVLSRTTMMEIADGDMTAAEIGRALDANAILEGTVRRAGDQVRITTQLIETPQDAHLWSNTYERALSVEEIFDIQADIAEQIAGALETQLTGGERQRIESAPTDDLAAYDAYLRGRNQYLRSYATLDPVTVDRALEHLRDAVRRDSTFGEAHAWLALAYALPFGQTPSRLDSATAHVRRAKALNPDLAQAYVAEGWIYGIRDSTAARVEAHRRAVELQPSNAFATSRLSDALLDHGRYADAVRLAKEAVQLAPREPVVLAEMADQLRGGGLYDASEAWVGPADPGDRARSLAGRGGFDRDRTPSGRTRPGSPNVAAAHRGAGRVAYRPATIGRSRSGTPCRPTGASEGVR